MSLIKYNKSIIPACDVSNLNKLSELIKQTCEVKGIGAYKIGFELIIKYGAKEVLEVIRNHTDLPVIYDHQKAATDIPDTGEKFVKSCKDMDAVIMFPQAGPKTEKEWIKAAQKHNLKVIIGGEMTHPEYLESDGGFIKADAPRRIYQIAADLGVNNFVVPGNKPEKIKYYQRILEEKGVKPKFYSPGLINQGGTISEGAKASGSNWHAIIGRGIYQKENMKKAAKELVNTIQ